MMEGGLSSRCLIVVKDTEESRDCIVLQSV